MFTLTITTEDPGLIARILGSVGTKDEATVQTTSKSKPKVEVKPEVKNHPALATAAPVAAVPEKDIFSQIKDATLSLTEVDRDTAVAVLAKFGAEKVTNLKPSDYEAYLKAANDKLAATKLI